MPSKEHPPPSSSSSPQDKIFYTVREPWQWVLKYVAERNPNLEMTEVESALLLPTGLLKAKQTPIATPNTTKRRSTLKKGTASTRCTLRMDIVEKANESTLVYSAHATSAALDGLEDKDELVRTLQRCRADHLNISPPSVLIKWDVTKEECARTVPALPVLPGNEDQQDVVAVLKEPMGSSGDGIFFVSNNEEMYEIVERHRQHALEDADFLGTIMEQKGRMPSWVLQAEVYPPLLIRNQQHKFHIRSYVAVLEKVFHEDLLDVFCFNRHEVRIANTPVDPNDPLNRDRAAHITNGSRSQANERVLLHNVPELASKQKHIELFCATTFQHFLPDMRRRISYSMQHAEEEAAAAVEIRKFSLAALDIMVTQEGRLYLLEVNVHPAAPPENTVQGEFKEHLVGLMQDLVDVVLGKKDTNWLLTTKILEENGKTVSK